MIALGEHLGVGLVWDHSPIKWDRSVVMLAYLCNCQVFLSSSAAAMGKCCVSQVQDQFATSVNKDTSPVVSGSMTAGVTGSRGSRWALSDIIAVVAYMQYWFPYLPS